MRLFWFGFGWFNVLLGTAGIFLPLLPTTPFLLLAAWCFARSSERFHDWLTNHPRLGPPIADWRAHGAISRRAKMLAMISVAASIAISIVLGVPGWALGAQLVCLAGAACFILTRPAPPSAARNG
jgi:uncharacterized protein